MMSNRATEGGTSPARERRTRTDRRRFLALGSGGVAFAAALAQAPAAIAQPKIQWRLSTTWPPVLDVMQGSARRLGKIVEEMSGGRFRIEVFAGGQIVEDLQCFDATVKGTIEAF